MKQLVQRLERLRFEDVVGRPLCREVLAVALRSNRFSVNRAITALARATDPDPGPPLASVPEQEGLVAQLMRSYTMGNEPERPRNLDALLAPLEALELKVEEGTALCREVLIAALEGSKYDVNDAAEVLLNATGPPPRDDWGPRTEEEKAIEDIRRLFVHLDWSTVATAYNAASHDFGKTLVALALATSDATPQWE
jgi:hypothetical protein